uniref:kinesin-like protein KIN-1 n=1 Tax=Erigeron canadensis TaxID=72917 RepID=UPI001CB8BA0D|nr:kinesin-like protein KIN-1 [Erigeron canadensis]
MANICVCARFRPANSKEDGESICISRSDSHSFTLKDEKDEQYIFSFDKVFYDDSEQSDVYDFLARPIVTDALNAINGTIITYGQTGAGKTYTMEGGNILETDNRKKGLLPRVVDELFEAINLIGEATAYKIKLSMVEIYMERVRDLFDLSKDNIKVKEHKGHGIMLCGVTEILISNGEEALKFLSSGVANRAVGETQMNMASSRSHCIYIFTVQKEATNEKRVSTGKLVLVDLAGSEKAEKTGAEGRVLEEAKTINKSLSALGNVINALTSSQQGKAHHIPYRDSKLTRILQDALGGSSHTALLCCCSPSLCNSSESLSSLRFGARAKHVKASLRTICKEDMLDRKQETSSSLDDVQLKSVVPHHQRILKKLREKLDAETVNMIEEEFLLDGLVSDPSSSEEVNSSQEELITSETISAWKEATDKLVTTIVELRREKERLMHEYGLMEMKTEILEQLTKTLKAKLKKSDAYSLLVQGLFYFAVVCMYCVLLISCYTCDG